MALVLSGCSRQAAPSFSLFGAYFSVWLFCMTIGCRHAAIGARVVLVASGLSAVVPAQLAVCTAIEVHRGQPVLAFFWLGR